MLEDVINKEELALWPEDSVPEKARACTCCELCSQRTRMIWGEGNPRGMVIVILDNPGSRENKDGQPFVCGTRQTLMNAAALAGFRQNDLYVTYVLKCRPKRKYDKAAALSACMVHLEQQLNHHRYAAAFCLGDRATKTFFGDPNISVKESRNQMFHIRGLSTFVSYHPLAVRRRPNLYPYFIDDWKTVFNFVTGSMHNQ